LYPADARVEHLHRSGNDFRQGIFSRGESAAGSCQNKNMPPQANLKQHAGNGNWPARFSGSPLPGSQSMDLQASGNLLQ
jgi:hypothetical protein